jgi:hypothetical protein
LALQLRQAQRSMAFLKLGVSAPSGGGKTLGALLIAYGLMKAQYPNLTDAERWAKIAIIDSENGSGELYVGSSFNKVNIGVYNAITLSAPFEAEKYTDALDMCQDAGIEVTIIDSLTHLWAGEGGLLELQNTISKRTGNSWTAWREISPQLTKFIDKMLQSPMHIIVTMRAKQEYAQEKDSEGRSKVKKLGLEPVMRQGIDYEFTTFFEIDSSHDAYGAKDRTSIFDTKTFKITPDVGEKLMAWLKSGVTTEHVVVATQKPVPANRPAAVASVKDEIVGLCVELGGQSNADLMTILKKYNPKANPNAIKDETQLSALRTELLEMKENKLKETA